MQFVVVSVVMIIAGSLWVITGLAVGKIFYDNVRKENHQERGKVIQRMLKTYTLIQCIGYPIIMISAWLLYVNKFVLAMLPPEMTRYAIIILRFVYTILRIYIGLNSLIIAFCRYSFIIHENKVFKFGINRIRSILLKCSIMIPIMLSFSNEATNPMEITWTCLFMTPTNSTHEVDLGNVTDIFCSRNNAKQIAESLIYRIADEYLLPSIMQGMKICHTVFIVIIASNVLEGFFYYNIFAHIKR